MLNYIALYVALVMGDALHIGVHDILYHVHISIYRQAIQACTYAYEVSHIHIYVGERHMVICGYQWSSAVISGYQPQLIAARQMLAKICHVCCGPCRHP
jgi:hypothetical protein